MIYDLIYKNDVKLSPAQISVFLILKGFATFWEFSFYRQKKVADYEYHSLFAEKIHFHT